MTLAFALEMLFKFLYYFVFLMCFIIWVRSCGHFPCIWKLLQFFLSSCCCRGREILTTWLANIYFFSGMLILILIADYYCHIRFLASFLFLNITLHSACLDMQCIPGVIHSELDLPLLHWATLCSLDSYDDSLSSCCYIVFLYTMHILSASIAV